MFAHADWRSWVLSATGGLVILLSVTVIDSLALTFVGFGLTVAGFVVARRLAAKSDSTET